MPRYNRTRKHKFLPDTRLSIPCFHLWTWLMSSVGEVCINVESIQYYITFSFTSCSYMLFSFPGTCWRVVDATFAPTQHVSTVVTTSGCHCAWSVPVASWSWTLPQDPSGSWHVTGEMDERLSVSYWSLLEMSLPFPNNVNHISPHKRPALVYLLAFFIRKSHVTQELKMKEKLL